MKRREEILIKAVRAFAKLSVALDIELQDADVRALVHQNLMVIAESLFQLHLSSFEQHTGMPDLGERMKGYEIARKAAESACRATEEKTQ